MVYPENGDVLVVRVPKDAAVPSANWTAAEKAALDDAIIALQQPQPLGAHSNFSEAGAADGKAILRSGAGYVLGDPSGAIAGIGDDTTPVIEADVTNLRFRQGLGVNAGAAGDGAADVYVAFAGTGAANTVARSDHLHTIDSVSRGTAAPSGYLSSGSRALASVNVTLAAGILYLVEADLYGQLRGADSGAAYYTLTITIDGNAFTSPGGSDGFWCVQGVPDKIKWRHERTVAGTGAAITASATVTYSAGAGFNVDRTYLTVSLRPVR